MKQRNTLRLRITCALLLMFVLALSGAHAAATKNIILMIGDGMGLESVKAGRYYLYGATGQLCFEPYYKCSIATSCLDNVAHPVTDSAAAGSALATGHKVNYTVISQLSPVQPATTTTPVLYTTILEHAKAMGKRTGLIGTDPITRATPAAFAAHDPFRDNMSSAGGIGDDYLNSSRPDVMMGGGGTFVSGAPVGSTYFSTAQINTAIGLGYQTAYTKDQMNALSNSASRVLGLFTTNEMSYEYDRRQNPSSTEPQLSEMTAKTLALMDTDPDGFFLMIEGAKIDYAGHQLPGSYLDRYLTWEVVAFNQAVQTVLTWMQGRTDTLLIVTADHETGGVTAYNNGAGVYPGITFSTNQHTGVNVPLYAVGSNADLVNDYISGGAMDNTNVYTVMSRAFTAAPYATTPNIVAAPYNIYNQYGVGSGSSGNVYYGGGVFNNTFYTGQITQNAQQWSDHQTGGTAIMNTTPAGVPSTNVAKCSIPMNGFPAAGGWLYMGGSTGGMYRTSSWASNTITQLTVPSGYATESICTDGTNIYMSSGTSAQYNKIFKYSINHSTGVLTFVRSWAVGTAATVRFRGISYYDDTPLDGDSTNGKVYATNFLGTATTGMGIYEIDTTSVTAPTTPIAIVPIFGANADNAYQVVRYGNQLYVVGLDDMLHTYQMCGTTSYPSWTLSSSVNLGLGDLYGIGVKGDGTTAQYAWVTHATGKVSYLALAPWTATPTDLTASSNWTNNNGYPVYMNDAVVTAVNPTTTPKGLWIQNKQRTMGAHVLWSGTMPAVNHLVSIVSGGGSVTTSGEKVLTASSVTANESYAARPLYMMNKSLGYASGGSGLENDGLLVTVSGRVTGRDAGTGAFYIDDGSGVPSGIGSPAIGVKIWKADGTGMTSIPNYTSRVVAGLPSFAVVTGVVRLDLSGSSITRRIDARSNADIVITALP